MKTSLFLNRHFYLWILIFGIAIFFRFHRIGEESFWLDEVLSARIVSGPYSEIINRIPPDKPPLEYYVQAFFAHLNLGAPEVWHRAPAAIFNSIAVVGVYFWALGWFGRRTALLAFILAAGNGFLLQYSQEARPYSMFTALTVWQMVLFGAWWRNRKDSLYPTNDTSNLDEKFRRRRNWMLLAGLLVLSLAAVYTLYAAFLVFAAEILFLLIAAPMAARGQAGSFRSKTLGAIARVYLPYLITLSIVILLVLPMRSRAQLGPDEAFYWKYQDNGLLWWIHIAIEFCFFGLPGVLVYPTAIMTTLLLLLGIARGWRANRDGVLQTAFTSILVIPPTLILYAWLDHMYVGRYLIFCVPGLCLLLALGIQALWQSLSRIRILRPEMAALITVIAYAGYSSYIYFSGKPRRDNALNATALIAKEAKPKDIVIVPGYENTVAFGYYLQRQNRADIRLYTQMEVAKAPDLGRVWRISIRPPGEEKDPLFPYRIEQVGGGPDPEEFPILSKTLERNARLDIADCPMELLDSGWGEIEKWNPETSIRYITRRCSGVYMPIRLPGSGRLTVRLYPYTFDSASSQSVQLIVGDKEFAVHPLPSNQFSELTWDIPEGLLHRGFNYVQFRFAYADTPASARKNYGDFRMLAAAVQWVRWRVDQP